MVGQVDTGQSGIQEATTDGLAVSESDRAARPASPSRLAFASFLMLFVELALIRWIAANNVFVIAASNFVLLASFLGIGSASLTPAPGAITCAGRR